MKFHKKLMLVWSGIYVFDAAFIPFMHIPLLYLTVIYLVAMGDLIGLSGLISWVRGRIANRTG